MTLSKVYLGDSVYADNDGWNVILTTDNGLGASNTIILEPSVVASLESYIKRFQKAEADDSE